MIPLLPLGCSNGLNPELEPSIDEVEPLFSFYKDAMPLVSKYSIKMYESGTQEIDYRSAAINYYETVQPIDLIQEVMDPPLNLPGSAGTIDFTAYSFLPGIVSQEIYAFTSGYLHYLPTGKSHPDLLGGAVADENMLILKPLVGTKEDEWKSSHPGTKSLIEECVYRNLTLLSDEKMLDLISLTTPDAYIEQQYVDKLGNDLENISNWPEVYLTLFKENPEIPLIVRGGEQIATTKENSPTDLAQRLTLLFKMGAIGETDEKWTDHDDDVKTFFKYFQRRDLAGHPMIAELLGQSVKSGTIDVISPLSSLWDRRKSLLITDFKSFKEDVTPDYHALALDLEQEPIRLIVPLYNGESILPGPVLRDDQLTTRVKISNPLGLQLSIIGNLPDGLSLTPAIFSATEQVVEIATSADFSPDIEEVLIQIATEDDDDVFQILLTFLSFFGLPVRFFKLVDTNPNRTTDMDEAKLLSVIDYSNNILGSQTNVYIYPVEDEGDILHQLNYPNDLGDIIVQDGGGPKDIYKQFAAIGQNETIDIVFVWDQSIKNGKEVGVTFRPDGYRALEEIIDYAIIFIDTKSATSYKADTHAIGRTVVHEIGHWLSTIFILWKNNKEIDDCYESSVHFKHNGCDGDWSLNSNLMAPSGSDNMFITIKQAKVYNENAESVNPNTVNPFP